MERILTTCIMLSVAAFTAPCYAGFGDLNPRFDFTFGDSSGMPNGVPDSTGQQTSADGQSVKLYGATGPISGADFRSGFVFYFNGVYEGPIHVGDYLSIDVDFSVSVTGGNIAWRYYTGLFTGNFTQILTPLMPLTSPAVVEDIHFQSPQVTEPSGSGMISGYIHINWTNFSPTDTFTITIPDNSLDITLIPEPAGLLLVALAIPFTLVRRRLL